MKSNVVRIVPNPHVEPKGKHRIPERFSLQQIERLHRLAGEENFTMLEVWYATRSVRFWAEGKDIRRTRWVAVVMNAMRLGWGLRGFDRWATKRSKLGSRGESITPDRIHAMLEALRSKGYE